MNWIVTQHQIIESTDPTNLFPKFGAETRVYSKPSKEHVLDYHFAGIEYLNRSKSWEAMKPELIDWLACYLSFLDDVLPMYGEVVVCQPIVSEYLPDFG